MSTEIQPYQVEFDEYLRDESRSVGHADSISFPKNEDELIEIVRKLSKTEIPVTVQGARTGLAAAAVPYGGHLINIGRMTRILGARYDEQDNRFFLTAEPGVLLSQLRKAVSSGEFEIAEPDDLTQAALCRYKAGEWFFSPDPTEASAALAGMVACNASGARSFCYGPVRPYVEALRLVLVDGRTLHIRRGEQKAKGRDFCLNLDDGSYIIGKLPDYAMPKVKNASGYYIEEDMDLIDLFIGGEGTLGIITQIELRLLPMPKAVWGITTFFPDEKSALRFVRGLRGEKEATGVEFSVKPAAIEFFNHKALDLLRIQKQKIAAFAHIQELKATYYNAVYTEFHADSEEKVWEMVEQMNQMLEALGVSPEDTWVANNPRDMEKLLVFRHAVPESVNMLIDQRRQKDPAITKLGTDMAVPDQYLDKIMDMYNGEIQTNGLDYVAFGHIGDNHLHVNILPRDMEDYRKGKALYLQWANAVSAMGGTVSAEHGVGKLKAPFLAVMMTDAGIEQMRALKAVFDPQGHLNPGNMFTMKKEGDA